jgi:hypothetical protein
MRFKPLALVALGMPAILAAQSIDTLSLDGRSSINLGIGLTGRRVASAGFSGVDAHFTGELGSLGFAHWINPEVALTISVASLGGESNVSGLNVTANAITPVLFGVSYSPRALAVSRALRPYVAVAAGPYFHSVVGASGFGNVGASTESVAGMRAAVGTNWFVAQHFFLSLEGNYNAVSQLGDGTKNPSGFGLSFGLGVNWGGR